MTTAAQLTQRRRVTAAARRRRPPRALPVAKPPSGIVMAYTRELLDLVSDLDEATETALRDLGIPYRVDAQGDAPTVVVTAAERAKVEARLQALAERVAGRRSLITSVASIADRTFEHSAAQWAAQLASMGVKLNDDVDLMKRAEAFRRENLSLIKSLTSDHVSRVGELLREHAGSRVETIAKRISEATGASKSRAALIARDQVLSLNAQVTEDRHKAAGVTEYVWRTSRDERVRKAHKDLDGTRQKYAEPPVADPRTGLRGNPGTVWQCRCVAEPLIPGFDD